FFFRQRREHDVFQALLTMVPGLEVCLTEGTEGNAATITEMLQKGMSTAISDETKGLKGPILNWIIPHGQSLQPPLACNIKTDHRFHHECTGSLLCPTGMDWSDPEYIIPFYIVGCLCFIYIVGPRQNCKMAIPSDQWPTFLYVNNMYDPEDPWKGLLRSSILVCAYKHVFTSPSSVDNAAKATWSVRWYLCEPTASVVKFVKKIYQPFTGNAHIHGMTHVTPASIASIATQAQFALSSSSVFSRTDAVTSLEGFYNSILDLLHDADEQEESKSLIIWWNRQIFPSHSSAQRPAATNSALTKIKEKQALKKAAITQENSSQLAA
ncbi:hypothetical protein PILCRDRAFT_60453, partial [Piloderma croceum F 1598]